MSDKEDTVPPKKSIPDLRAISTGQVLPLPAPDAKVKKDKGPKSKDLHHTVVQAMCGKTHGWPAFPAKLHQWLDPVGESTTYIEKDGVIRPIGDAGIERIIAQYWQDILPTGPRPISLGAMAADDATKIRKLWTMTAIGNTKPFPLVVWQSDPRAAHHRMAFDPLPISYYDFDKYAPCFHEFMSRTTNHEAFMGWVGSLFDEHSQRQQYVWMYGAGMNGKSAVMRAIGGALGSVVMSQKTPQFGDKFWSYSMLHKRLVYFPDCNNASFVTTGDFKELTGEDPVRIEDKYKRPFSAQLPSKFLFISNAKPRISSIKADLRRIIYCGIGDIPAAQMKGTNYEDLLRDELPAFLSLCWERYQTLTNNEPRRMFDTDAALADGITEETEHEFEAFVDTCLVVSSEVPTSEWLRAGDMQEMLMSFGFRGDKDRQKCREFLARKYGVIPDRVYQGEKQVRVYKNCKKSDSYHLVIRRT